MRHGRAVPETASLPNFRRYLTDTGKTETRMMAVRMANYLGNTPVGIYISPLVRTQETAAILAEELRRGRLDNNVTSATLYALCRNDWEPVEDYLLNVKAVQGLDHVFLVSHQPFLEDWVKRLTGASLNFRRSGIAIVNWKRNGKSRLLAYLTPQYWGAGE